MAATGLLGVNPYYKGTALDVSKPVNLAIQLEEKEQAKKEAIDKYFMDYEKSLNPAGMRQQDQDVFLRKLQDNKAYYLKNREKILNPAKYGAEAQSEYMAKFKGILSDIDRSKQLAANGKVIQTALLDAKKNNRTVPKEVTDAIYNNELSIGDPNHQAFDLINFDAYDKHDPFKYGQNVYSKIKLSEMPATKVWNPSLKEYQVETVKDYTKDAIAPLRMNVMSELKKDRGLQDQIKFVMSDPNQLAHVADEYQKFTGVPMKNTIDDIALAYTISLKPPAVKEYKDFNDWQAKEMFKINYENNLVSNNFKEITRDILNGAMKNPVPINITGKRGSETWYEIPLTNDIKKDFTVTRSKMVPVKNPDYDSSDPNSEPFILKPSPEAEEKSVNHVRMNPNGRIFASVSPVDASGRIIGGKADEIELTPREFAKQISKSYKVSDKSIGVATDAIVSQINDFKKNLKTTSAPSKQIKASEIPTKAAAAGYSPEEYRKLLIQKGVKII